MRLDSQVVIVTGGGNGIGQAFCRRFAAEGAKVVVADVDVNAAGRVARDIATAGGSALAVAANVTSATQIQAMVERTLEEFGQIDVLVNNAGIYPEGKFLQITEEEWDRVLDINLKGTFLCSQAVARHMVERRQGKIINISSGAFLTGAAFEAHYVASKAGVVGLTRAMARELGAFGINVNCIAPGLTNTETALSRSSEEAFAALRKGKSIQRDQYPEDLVGAAVFFASQGSDFITGQTLPVEGGRSFV